MAKQSAEIALVVQGIALAYVVSKGEMGEALLLSGSMIATWLSSREAEAKETLERKGALGPPSKNFDEYVIGLKQAQAGVAKA